MKRRTRLQRMRARARGILWFLGAAVCLVLGLPAQASAEELSRAVRPAYSLARCLELAAQNYPRIAEATAKLRKAEAQRFEAYTAPFSEFTSTSGLALAPTLRGTSVFSPNSDVALNSNLALAWQVGIEGVVPLWTFGKISNLQDAANAQVDLGEHQVQKAKDELSLAVRRAYYGLQLARDALDLVRSARKTIDSYVARLQESVDEGDADETDLLELRMYRAELVARESEAQKEGRVARAGLAFLTGVPAVDIPDVPIERIAHQLAPVTQYLSAARLHRPEINMARAGVMAREAQWRLEQAKYFPDLGLGLSAQWSRAPEITDQVNPFVRDRANFLNYGVGLVLRWKLDFLPQSARVARAAAELEEIRATERFALGGVGVEVEKAFEEAKAAEARLQAYSEAAAYAKRWLIIVQQGIDLGTYEDKDLVNPAKEYALKRFSRLMATFDYNVALAALAAATGWKGMLGPE